MIGYSYNLEDLVWRWLLRAAIAAAFLTIGGVLCLTI